jgi:hypothetical protein
MNVVKFAGGLGNQLFQYAFGQAIQQSSGAPTFYDKNWYVKPTDPLRPYLLDKFPLNISFADGDSLERYREARTENEPIWGRDNVAYSGYWQDPSYLTPTLTEQLRKAFHVKEEFYTDNFKTLLEDILSHNSIALHVRRGDFVNHPRHLVLSLSYYRSALLYMSSFKKDVKVFIFSDDIPWCKENFGEVTFIEENDYLSFELMRACKHFIISNSTFSWWPAYLSLNSTVIAPGNWGKDRKNGAVLHERRMLFGNDWFKLRLS